MEVTVKIKRTKRKEFSSKWNFVTTRLYQKKQMRELELRTRWSDRKAGTGQVSSTYSVVTLNSGLALQGNPGAGYLAVGPASEHLMNHNTRLIPL